MSPFKITRKVYTFRAHIAKIRIRAELSLPHVLAFVYSDSAARFKIGQISAEIPHFREVQPPASSTAVSHSLIII